MLKCYNDHPPKVDSEREQIINDEPKYTLGDRIKKNDKNYIEISTRDTLEKDVITDTYNILTKDEHHMKLYNIYRLIDEREFLFIQFEGKNKRNKFENPILKFNIRYRSFVASKINEDKLSEWDKEDIIENIKRIAILD
jgi:hypothetical protein